MIDHKCVNKVLLHDLLERLENDGNISCEIINKRAGPNKRAGWNFLKKIINEQGQIRASRMEIPQIINKRACSIIRQLRVRTY